MELAIHVRQPALPRQTGDLQTEYVAEINTESAQSRDNVTQNDANVAHLVDAVTCRSSRVRALVTRRDYIGPNL